MRNIVLLVLSCAVSLVALGQNTTASADRGAKVLSVRLVAPSPVGCAGFDAVSLEAILTNTSEEIIEISPDGVYGGGIVSRYEGREVADSAAVLADVIPRRWTRILPHESVVVPFARERDRKNFLKAERMLQSAGLYSLEVAFQLFVKSKDGSVKFSDTVRSNPVLLVFSECSDAKKN